MKGSNFYGSKRPQQTHQMTAHSKEVQVFLLHLHTCLQVHFEKSFGHVISWRTCLQNNGQDHLQHRALYRLLVLVLQMKHIKFVLLTTCPDILFSSCLSASFNSSVPATVTPVSSLTPYSFCFRSKCVLNISLHDEWASKLVEVELLILFCTQVNSW